MSDLPAPHVYTAISAVMGIMAKEGISKGRKNQQQGYNFRGIDDVYDALCGVMSENKLVILPFVRDMQREERTTQKGGVLNYTILTVDFTFASAVDGSTATVRMVGEAMDSADKSSNKAQSAALKYAALQVFMIPTEGDNDADATTHEVKPKEGVKQMPDAEFSKLEGLRSASGVTTGALCKKYAVKDLRNLTQDQFSDCIEGLQGVIAKKAKEQSDQQAAQHSDDLNDSINF